MTVDAAARDAIRDLHGPPSSSRPARARARPPRSSASVPIDRAWAGSRSASSRRSRSPRSGGRAARPHPAPPRETATEPGSTRRTRTVAAPRSTTLDGAASRPCTVRPAAVVASNPIEAGLPPGFEVVDEIEVGSVASKTAGAGSSTRPARPTPALDRSLLLLDARWGRLDAPAPSRCVCTSTTTTAFLVCRPRAGWTARPARDRRRAAACSSGGRPARATAVSREDEHLAQPRRARRVGHAAARRDRRVRRARPAQ